MGVELGAGPRPRTPRCSVPCDDERSPGPSRGVADRLDAHAAPLPQAAFRPPCTKRNLPTTASDANPANATAGRCPSGATPGAVSYLTNPIRLTFRCNPSSKNSGCAQTRSRPSTTSFPDRGRPSVPQRSHRTQNEFETFETRPVHSSLLHVTPPGFAIGEAQC